MASSKSQTSSPKRRSRADTPREKVSVGPELVAEAEVAKKGVIDLKLVKQILKWSGRGVPGAAAARPRPQRRSRHCPRCCPTRFTLTNVLLLATLLAVILGTNRQIFEGLGKVTQALGDTMEAAGTLAGTGVNATVKVTNKALDVLSTAVTAADELFYGVDLMNVSIERKACKSAGVTSVALSAWLVLQGPFPDRMNRWFAEQVLKTTADVPFFEIANDGVDITGSCHP